MAPFFVCEFVFQRIICHFPFEDRGHFKYHFKNRSHGSHDYWFVRISILLPCNQNLNDKTATNKTGAEKVQAGCYSWVRFGSVPQELVCGQLNAQSGSVGKQQGPNKQGFVAR